MELIELKESVRRNLVKNDLNVLDILATGHNLIMCIENQQWGRLGKKTYSFVGSYNNLIAELNKKETPVEDEIMRMEKKIEELKG